MKRRGDEPAVPERHGASNVDTRAGAERGVDPEAVDVRHLANDVRHRLEQQRYRKQPRVHAALLIRGHEPRQQPAHIDRGRQIQVRNVALRSAHRRRNRGAHGRRAVRSGCRHGAGQQETFLNIHGEVFLGSVAAQIVASASCPVVTVRGK